MLRLLKDVADAAEKAVKASKREMWDEDEGIGADGTRTSGIDKIAETAVLHYLDGEGNPVNVLSEECGFLDFGREKTLIIDPIDGTYNALRDIPLYSISLAIASNSMADTSLALIRNLSTGDEFRAEKGKGAQRNGIRIRSREFHFGDSVFSVMLGKRAHKDAYRIAEIPKRVRGFGSAALEIAMVASGTLDLYYYRAAEKSGGLRIVDIAAGTLILREAGGEVYNEKGVPVDMELDVKRRTSVMAVGDKSILEVLI